VLFHINGVLVRVEMGILSGVGAAAVAEDLPCDIDTGHTVEVCCGAMTE
jgi:hypothetical protein